jgi:hypothetical protein
VKSFTIIASQLPPASRFDVVSASTVSDAILDGVHKSQHIDLMGEILGRKGKNWRLLFSLWNGGSQGGNIAVFPSLKKKELKTRIFLKKLIKFHLVLFL